MEKKSPDAFRTISEVAEWLGTPTHVLRFWESRFAQVKPVKRAGGRRYYRPADMMLLGGIKKLLHEDGMTIRGVQKLLREEGVKRVAAMSPPLDGETAEHGEVIEAPFVEAEPAPEPRQAAPVVDLDSARGERERERAADTAEAAEVAEAADTAEQTQTAAGTQAEVQAAADAQPAADAQAEVQADAQAASPARPAEADDGGLPSWLPGGEAPAPEPPDAEPGPVPSSEAPVEARPGMPPEPPAEPAAPAATVEAQPQPQAAAEGFAPPSDTGRPHADPEAIERLLSALRAGARPDPARVAPILARLQALAASFEANAGGDAAGGGDLGR